MTTNTVVITETQVNVTNVGEQGVAGPNTILNKSVVDGTVSVNNSLLVYNSSSDKWTSTVVPVGLTISGGSF
tara:strand:+ start:11925 stop:12140 length:216 start_codon:yes stop_codon:yes gene_type:complete